MASALRRPTELSFDGNVSENLRRFFLEFDIYVAAAHPKANGATKVNIFLNLAGIDAIERSQAFTFDDQHPRDNVDSWKQKFRELCQPMRNLIIIRHGFNSRYQKSDESFQAFLTDVRNRADMCEFGDMRDSMLRDRIVVGIHNEKTRNTLFAEPQLELARAIELCELHEGAEKASALLKKEAEVSIVRTKKTPKFDSKKTKCRACDYEHVKGQCPAYGKKCSKCGRKNHFAAVCRTTESKKKRFSKKLHEVDLQDEESEDRDISQDPDGKNYVIESLEQSRNNEINVTATCESNNFDIKIDTGAKVNVISVDTIARFKLKERLKIKSSEKLNLVCYSNVKMSTLGSCQLPLTIAGKNVTLTFQVVSLKKKPILGLKDALKLGLIDLHPEVHELDEEKQQQIPEDILSKYGSLFSELPGTLPVTYKMKLRRDAQPVIKPARKVPVAKKERIKQELDKMESNRIITKVTEATDWVSSMVAAEKKNTDELRICIDPRDLNEALMRPHHALKTVDDILSDVAGATIFSKLDAKSGFWHIPLDKKSSLLTTFNTPFGRYRFLKMPYGINSGSEVFQRAMEELMENYPCKIIVDDIIVFGKDMADHDRNLEIVMKRLKEIDLHLNRKKCEFRVSQIPFVGNIFTAEGLKVDPEKVKAIQEMPTPTSKQEVQRFLGMTNYLGRYIPHHSDKTRNLRSLTRNDVLFNWDANHEKEFVSLKQELCEAPVLAYYDVKQPVTLTCDASKEGLGAACLQNGKPVAFASRVLTPCEQKWAQIEKELLAIVFACSKFHQYVYGKEVHVESDHKPLEIIHRKPLESASARMQSMLLKLQRYNLKVGYKKGKEMFIADTLSRAFLNSTPDDKEQLEFQVMTLDITDSTLSPTRYDQLAHETAADEVLSKISSIITQGQWPSKFNSAPSWLQPYFSFRDELNVDDGIVFRGSKIIVPKNLRSIYISQLHKMHMSADSTLKLAKEYFYWPKMSEDIFYFVDQCSICNSSKPHQQKEPLHPHDTPARPFEIVGTDLFDFGNKQYIVIVDSYSNFFDFAELEKSTSKSVIDFLKKQFSTHGIPSTLISDNASYFKSQEFKAFAQQWNFAHTTSSPHFPQSNGLSERAVRSAKELLKKCEKDNTDVRLALLLLRNVPRDNNLKSPAERLFSRKTNIGLPTSENLLQPRTVRNVQTNLYNKRVSQKNFHDKSAKPLPVLSTNQTVRVQTDSGHEKLGFVKSEVQPRSYIVNINGKDYRRNRQHLLAVGEKKPAPSPTVDISPTPRITPKPTKDTFEPPPPPPTPPTSSPPITSAPKTTSSGREVKLPARYQE